MDSDPYIIRLPVRASIFLEPEVALPIRLPELWNSLSFTKDHDPRSNQWTGIFRSSLNALSDADGRLPEDALARQAQERIVLPLADQERAKFLTVRTVEGDRSVSVPEKQPASVEEPRVSPPTRTSLHIQGLLADIGRQMGFRIWLPRNDRGAVLRDFPSVQSAIVDTLPLKYDDTTLRTIEQIDLLWLRGRAIVRAYEIEHTTAIYSGILRMADLLALQPNLRIATHIVAPAERRESVLDQIRRPVFALMDRGPLADTCTYISYESVQEVAASPHLQYLSDKVLDDYAEAAD